MLARTHLSIEKSAWVDEVCLMKQFECYLILTPWTVFGLPGITLWFWALLVSSGLLAVELKVKLEMGTMVAV